MCRQDDPLTELENSLKKLVTPDPAYKAFREKTTRLQVLGLRLPLMQKREQAGFSFYQKEKKDILKEWNSAWNRSHIHEVLSLPLFYYRRHKKELTSVHWKYLKNWIERVENWEHADSLCYLYSFLYERYPNLVEPTLKQWNRSKNPWKRRASVVSTIYYASKNRKAPSIKTVLLLIEPLIQDKNPYVQKAVGWQLREAYKLWPEEILLFLKKHLLGLPAITFSYATEKLSKKEKEILKNQRWMYRKKKQK
ncbi:MAG: alkylation repair enzyme protein [Candidatus Uhrbacteria bacterium GW2011_GWF2_39_13]|uniref:Alkylation repair enzyme protein n=1 Tax=Candidatus Uhrbacteria bacterium GW2011_GWF2_39_13 TaxID=1618995 RepID=A0A0G0Q142_9BACT|nr:MAG: alkylation repair enzyme protein [Candidatus Uhrbacteria bacterium GW2011_GWF2_39_13]HAU65995.1 hypothetical protein [Candidatus Uhrbacteria bacterium]